MQTLPLAELREYIENAPAIPVHKDRSEVRVYASIITGSMVWGLLQPAIYILWVPASTLGKVAGLTQHPTVIAALFLVWCLLVLPHLAVLVGAPQRLGVKLPRKMACGAMAGAGVTWGMLATVAGPLDIALVPWTFWISAVGYMLVGGAFGYSLNAQQAQEKEAIDAAASPEVG